MDSYRKTGYLEGDFRLFHIVDEEERDFSYHYHDFHKILLFIRGDVTYHIEGKAFDLMPYDLVLVNAGEIHRPVINSRGIYERIVLYLSPAFLGDCSLEGADLADCLYRAKENNSNVLRTGLLTQSRLYQTLQELEKALNEEGFAAPLYRKTLLLESLILLNRLAMDPYNSVYIENNRCNSRILPVLEYIGEHLADEMTIESLAAQFYMSRYYLMHLFKQETGYSVASYISTKRLLLARTLIREGLPVTQACYQCGFRNYSSFSRAYKKLFHASASEETKQ